MTEKEVKVFPLRGITISGMQQCIEDTLRSENLYSPDLLYRIYTSKRIPVVQSTGNDRSEEGLDPDLLKRQIEPGYDLKHTIWADKLDHLKVWTNKGRNLLLLSAISVYDKAKTRGKSTYHFIETEDPRDALVAVFKRSNSPLLHLAGKTHLAFTQGPIALWESLGTDFDNIKEYIKG